MTRTPAPCLTSRQQNLSIGSLATVVGLLHVAVSPRGVTRIALPEACSEAGTDDRAENSDGWLRESAESEQLLRRALQELREYFLGSRREFSVPLDLQGTDFQLRVWQAVAKIGYGMTTSYGAIAYDIGAPGKARAVGAANRANPAPIIVPCHRVIGASGSLNGYGGGLPMKRWLLQHEGSLLV